MYGLYDMMSKCISVFFYISFLYVYLDISGRLATFMEVQLASEQFFSIKTGIFELQM